MTTIKITNLSESTRASIKRNDTVILNAGYEGDVGCILIGKVVGLKHKQNNVDWTSTVTVQPCADEILGKLINKTYTENIKASAIVRDLLNIFGIEVAKCELANDISYPRGRVCRKPKTSADGNNSSGVQKPIYRPHYRSNLYNKS